MSVEQDPDELVEAQIAYAEYVYDDSLVINALLKRLGSELRGYIKQIGGQNV